MNHWGEGLVYPSTLTGFIVRRYFKEVVMSEERTAREPILNISTLFPDLPPHSVPLGPGWASPSCGSLHTFVSS